MLKSQIKLLMEKPYEIVVLSGKGGTGKTSVVSSFATMADSAVYVDCDVDAANLHLIMVPEVYHSEPFDSGSVAVIDSKKCSLCGICKDLCRFDAIDIINDLYIVDEYACEGCNLCIAACPDEAITLRENENNSIYFGNSRFGPVVYGKLGIAEENSGKLVSKIRQYAKLIAIDEKKELIISDGPPGIGCPVIASVTGADLVVAVTEPTLSGWHDLERLIELVGRFKTPMFVIINKCDLNGKVTEMIEANLEKMNIPVLGRLKYDSSVIDALLEEKTIIEASPDSSFANELKNIWDEILSFSRRN